MKIQSINLFTNRALNNNQVNKQQFFKTNSIQFDTVSFSARPAEASNIVKAKIRAEEVKKEADEIKAYADEQALVGYDVLDETKNTFMQALKYIDMARVAVKNNQANFELEDGRSLAFLSVVDKGKVKPLMINVYDNNNRHTQTITLKNNVPTNIEEYNSDGTIRNSSFNGNSIIVMDDVEPLEGNKIGTMYVYNGGQLMAIRKNRMLAKQPMVDEKSFFYNEQGDLWLAESNTQMHLTGKRVVEDRYSFVGGKLYNYYSEFSKSPNDLMSWGESYHYDQYKFLGKVENAKQKAKGQLPIAENAIYMDTSRKFVEAEDVNCKINDFATVEFSENK